MSGHIRERFLSNTKKYRALLPIQLLNSGKDAQMHAELRLFGAWYRRDKARH